MTGAAAFEENAELQELRERADQTGHEAAQTLAELAGRVADARDPKVVARRVSARARAVTTRARQRMPDTATAKRAALAMVPALSLLALAIISHRRGWQLPHSRRLPSPPSAARAGALQAGGGQRAFWGGINMLLAAMLAGFTAAGLDGSAGHGRRNDLAWPVVRQVDRHPRGRPVRDRDPAGGLRPPELRL